MRYTIELFSPAGPDNQGLLGPQLAGLPRDLRDQICTFPAPSPAGWPFTAGTAAERAQALAQSFSRPSRFLWATRGGYGCQEILPLIDWPRLGQGPEKIVVGFSDLTALQAALWHKLGWKSLHAPMLASGQWPKNAALMLPMWETLLAGKSYHDAMPLTHLWGPKTDISGTLVGGCFSVLTNLIGTGWLPSLDGKILFLEDTGEHPGRLMRYFEQWRQTQSFRGVKAIIFGDFHFEGQAYDWQLRWAPLGVPLYQCGEFGHGDRNRPIGIGCRGEIQSGLLRWQLEGSNGEG